MLFLAPEAHFKTSRKWVEDMYITQYSSSLRCERKEEHLWGLDIDFAPFLALQTFEKNIGSN
jgi:hypothetical protein